MSRWLLLGLCACTTTLPEPASDKDDDTDAIVGDDDDDSFEDTDVFDDSDTDADRELPADVADCDAIAARPGFEVCDTTASTCGGVFTGGEGCAAYCAEAGMVCTERYGGEPGCQIEWNAPIACDADNGHQSDYCFCGLPDSEPAPTTGACDVDPANPPLQMEQGRDDAVYSERHNWAVTCRSYAYTAAGDEHEDCDSTYSPDGSRHGKATFTFTGVPKGEYEVYVQGRHTENRNPAGALFLVNGNGVVIDQQDESGDILWDLHGTWCLEGTVEVVLDSTVNGGSDSVQGARLVPVP